MTLEQKQTSLVERFAIITDPQERLAAVVAHRSRLESLHDAERIDDHLVRGCVSRVWVAGTLVDGVFRLRTDAESPLVRGLVSLLCELYDGAAVEEVAAFEPQLFEELGIAKNLSPTRVHGLGCVRSTIRDLAVRLPA